MAKGSGTTRLLGPSVKDTSEGYRMYLQNLSLVQNTEGGKEWNFFDNTSGGSVITEKGHNIANKEEELEFAKSLSEKGYSVVLSNEKDGISLRISKAGDKRFPEGMAGQYEVYYEQSTPTKPKSGKKGYYKALVHASDKGAEVAAVYDKYNVLHREDLDRGLIYYNNELRRKHPETHRPIKGVVVLNSKGEWYEHWI